MATATLKRPGSSSTSKLWDQIGNGGVIAMASIVVLILLAIYVFIGSQSFQTFTQSHLPIGTFLFSKDWQNSEGTLVLTVDSLMLVVFGLLIAIPLSLGSALFITEIAPPWMARVLRSIVELFLGIPSIIFGLIGVLVVVPLVRTVVNGIAGDQYFTTGDGIIPAAIVVSFMVLPTITTITVDSLAAIPNELREGSLALGATRWQTMTKTLLPTALPGFMTGVILGTARIIGETIAVALVIGGSSQIFGIDIYHGKLFIGTTSVITTQIFQDFPNTIASSTDPQQQLLYHSLWTLSFLLLVISGLLVLASRAVTSRSVYK